MTSFLPVRPRLLAALSALAYAFLLLCPLRSAAQSPADSPQAPAGRILLVLPFDNRTGQPSLEWMREASAEVLSSRLASAGFSPMSRADRLYALDHLGLPQGFHPSRASSLKLAETLDAEAIIVGSYVTDGSGIIAEARIVDLAHLRMGEAVTARGEMRQLVSLFDSLAWKLARQLDPSLSLTQQSFIDADSALRLDAFEQYIRGITEPDQQERLGHLNQAVLLSPDYAPAWMALGREQYAGQQYELAAAAFAKVGPNSPDALEAGFLHGLCLLFSGDYPRAQQAFAGVARVLPLAEVLNNQAVAFARQKGDATSLFRQAVAADPSQPDYHFNLALSLKRQGDLTLALSELAEALRLHPDDAEALALEQAWSQPAKSSPRPPVAAAASTGAPAAIAEPALKPDPLERIARSFNAAAFRQAALIVDRMDSARLAQLPPQERARQLIAEARDYLDKGLLVQAGRLYRAALDIDPKSASAHAGLAQVDERSGNAEAAHTEAVASLELMPSVEAYLVLIRQQIAAHRFYEAQQNLTAALRIDPSNQTALDLRKQIQTLDGMKK